MSFDTIHTGWRFSETAHAELKSQQLRLKAEALKEKAKLTEEKVGIAKKNAELFEAIHQIKTAKALQIVEEATETAHTEGENLKCKSDLSAVINEIRKKQYVEAVFAAVEAADAHQLAISYEKISSKLTNAVGIVEEVAKELAHNSDMSQNGKIDARIEFAEKLVDALEQEELDLQMPVQKEGNIELLMRDKEQERQDAIQKVRQAALESLKAQKS